MKAKYDALIRNNTWTFVALLAKMIPIGCKWVFRVNENSDGSVNKYKARLVAKGFHQQFGTKYAETFFPSYKTCNCLNYPHSGYFQGLGLTTIGC